MCSDVCACVRARARVCVCVRVCVSVCVCVREREYKIQIVIDVLHWLNLQAITTSMITHYRLVSSPDTNRPFIPSPLIVFILFQFLIVVRISLPPQHPTAPPPPPFQQAREPPRSPTRQRQRTLWIKARQRVLANLEELLACAVCSLPVPSKVGSGRCVNSPQTILRGAASFAVHYHSTASAAI